MIKHHSLLTLLVPVFLLAGGLTGCCEALADDHHEPNDYPEQASPIAFNDPIEARVSSQSSDYYSVKVGEPTDLWVLVTLDFDVWSMKIAIVGPDGTKNSVGDMSPWSCNPKSDECLEEGFAKNASAKAKGLIYKVLLPAQVSGEYIISVHRHALPHGDNSCGESTQYTLLLSEEYPETEH